MPDRDVATIKDPIYYQYAKIKAKSAFAASDGESLLKHRGDKKFYDSIPPVLPSAAATATQARRTETIGRERRGNGAGHRCCYSVRRDEK